MSFCLIHHEIFQKAIFCTFDVEFIGKSWKINEKNLFQDFFLLHFGIIFWEFILYNEWSYNKKVFLLQIFTEWTSSCETSSL